MLTQCIKTEYNPPMSAQLPNGMKTYADPKRKICTQCKQTKPIEEFYLFRKNAQRRRNECSVCSNKQSMEYRNKNKERCNGTQRRYYANNKHVAIAQNLRRYYGMTIEQYDKLYADQNGKCAICEKAEDNRKKQRLSVDHDHKTGQVRGLLCDRHNRALGMLHDSIDTLQRAIDYLKKFRN